MARMTFPTGALRRISLALPILLLTTPLPAQEAAVGKSVAASALPAPTALQTGGETPWLYEDSDIPQDKDWLFGKMDNGVRYAVRHNGVPPGQVSIRVLMDAGSLHELDHEQGYAHLLEHMVFRQSKYLGPGEAIPTFQRLGATFGYDTNASTTPTQTVYQMDLPEATPAKLDEIFKLLSGMMREPVFNKANLAADLPIVLAEKRERGGAASRVEEATRKTLFSGQRLAIRLPIGTEETLNSATPETIRAFHDRWYRPENAIVVVAGDLDPKLFASMIEKYFGDWKGKGPRTAPPAFGDPVAPAGADPQFPLGETAVLVEPDLPRSLTYAVMRPWRPVKDTIVYNEGLMLDSLAQAIINRRLEARARAGGSYLYAQVYQEDVYRSTDATFVTVAPLSQDWQSALADVRAVIADALAEPPTQEEIDREAAEFDVALASTLEQASVRAGSELADNIVEAVNIRETVAAPDVVLNVFRNMRDKMTPANILAHTRTLFAGDVVRSVYVTPQGEEADAAALRTALSQSVDADGTSRLAAQTISFDDLPKIGKPGTIVSEGPIGLLEIEQVNFANGAKAILWANDAEPGRVAVKVRFGAGERAFTADTAPYKLLGEMALVGSGVGELGQEELDRITTGRKMGFDFGIEDGVFTFDAQTRSADLADQLYLFAAKLGMPRWDANPVLRAKAAAALTYESFGTSPGGVLNRDLDYYLNDADARFAMPTPEQIAAMTPEQFRTVWEPLLKQGPVEVLIFGEFDRDATVRTLAETFGALPAREPIPAATLARMPAFPDAGEPIRVLNHRGDPDQAAAVVSWPTGGGVADLRESRQLEILSQLFNNRLMDVMREESGASYTPQVGASWPVDIDTGGQITALGQIKPEDVPTFFAAADKIASELAASPPSADELERVTEPLKQLISRASTGNSFWLYQLQGASSDPRRIALMRSLLNDYSQTTPERMQQLAQKYLAARPGYKLAVVPEGTAVVTGAK